MPQPTCTELQRLERFLCLGKDSGIYRCRTDLTTLNYSKSEVQIIEAALRLDYGGSCVMNAIRRCTQHAHAAVRNPALFALAVCARRGDPETKTMAYEALRDVCLIPTDFFYFVSQHMRVGAGDNSDAKGWGRAARRALSRWYLDNPNALNLARHVTKYPRRHRWHHRDVLKVAHTKSPVQNAPLSFILAYIRHGLRCAEHRFRHQTVAVTDVAAYLNAVRDVKSGLLTEAELVTTIQTHRLNREHLLSDSYNSPEVWRALLPHMPMMAMIRNLGKMTSLDILGSGTQEAARVISKLSDSDQLRQSRVHPFNLLLALRAYESGHGEKGKLTWDPNSQIVDELELAFNQSFCFTEPTGQRLLLAVDVSMSDEECQIDPHTAAAVLAMHIARSEREFEIVYFTDEIRSLNINATMRLSDVMKLMTSPTDPAQCQACDCAKPIKWAIEKDKNFDVFIIFTSCRTITGRTYPVEALRDYRQRPNADRTKLVVVSMVSNSCSIVDVTDHLILNVVGFDSSGLEIINNFIRRVC
ncbi:hypothetical protein LSAT2_025389 [Lamellibrachia satsuma]|nr:hypothetical protein LSAT2_025389 [Lamellibrachia satsuma]